MRTTWDLYADGLECNRSQDVSIASHSAAIATKFGWYPSHVVAVQRSQEKWLASINATPKLLPRA